MNTNPGSGNDTTRISAAGGVGIQALTVNFPRVVRTNSYLRECNPQLVEEAERKSLARLFPRHDTSPQLDTFDREMAPFLADPFRGSRERRVLAPGETALSLEIPAATAALAAANLAPEDIDLMLVCSFLPDQLGPGNAAFLARELGLRAPAWNVESTCSSALVALETATAMVSAGNYETILVVISCTYSRVTDHTTDTLGWFMGDGAGAFIVGRVAQGSGILGFKTINTTATCDTFYNELFTNEVGQPRIRIQASPATGRILRATSAPFLLQCCEGAAKTAGVHLADIDFLVCNTPAAWYAAFSARTLGFDSSKTINTHPLYGNIGPALMTANLYHAAQSGRIREGDLVLVYTVGSASTASAVVMRWGNTVLGPPPPPSSELPKE